MDAGRLRHRVVLQRFNGTVDDYGDARQDVDANWEPVATVWAAVDPVAGREFYANYQAQAELSHKVSVRYRSDVRAGMRVLLEGSRRLEIESVIDWEERHEHLLLMCREVR